MPPRSLCFDWPARVRAGTHPARHARHLGPNPRLWRCPRGASRAASGLLPFAAGRPRDDRRVRSRAHQVGPMKVAAVQRVVDDPENLALRPSLAFLRRDIIRVELESGIIAERVRIGMREKAVQGGFNGMSAPFGYD